MMTPEYASPEQVRGERVTASSDIYSLGVLLFQLLTGRRPERGAKASPNADAEISRMLPPGLDEIVQRSMRENPRDRYASVADLAEDIKRHGEALPLAAYSGASVGLDPDTADTTGPKTIAIMPLQTIGAEDKTDEYLGRGHGRRADHQIEQHPPHYRAAHQFGDEIRARWLRSDCRCSRSGRPLCARRADATCGRPCPSHGAACQRP